MPQVLADTEPAKAKLEGAKCPILTLKQKPTTTAKTKQKNQ